MSALGTPIAAGRTAEIYAWNEGQVLKLFRPEFLPQLADKEAAIGRRVVAAGVPAPVIFDVIEQAGRRGIVYERIDGASMLQHLAQKPWMVDRLAGQFGALHAGMHFAPCPELQPRCDQIRYEIEQAPGLTAPQRTEHVQALLALPDSHALCHGDFHPDNVILSPRGPVIIDWMTAGHGNPDADVARTVLIFRVGPLPVGMNAVVKMVLSVLRKVFVASYLRAYRRRRPIADAVIDAWMPIVAAARMTERISEEEAALNALVRRIAM